MPILFSAKLVLSHHLIALFGAQILRGDETEEGPTAETLSKEGDRTGFEQQDNGSVRMRLQACSISV